MKKMFFGVFAVMGSACLTDDDNSKTGGLDDPAAGFSKKEECEDPDLGQVNDVPGATSFYAGYFELIGEDVTGTEEWILLPNEHWSAASGAADCSFVWNIVGKVTEVSSCAACDFGLALTASLDNTASDCISGPEAGFESQQIQYDVAVDANGNSTFYYPSGSKLGEGYSNAEGSGDLAYEGHVNYATAGTCVWF